MGIRDWRHALSERLGRLDITSLAQAQAIEEMQQVIAKAELTDGKTDINSVSDPSSDWSRRAGENPTLSEIGASREGASSSGKGAEQLIRRFSDLAEGDKTSQLYAQLGECLKAASVMAAMLEKMSKAEIKKSSHLRDVVRNLVKGLREVAKALGADDDEGEEDEGDDREEGDLEKSLRQAMKSHNIPEFKISEAMDIVSGRKSAISEPPNFAMSKAGQDAIGRCRELLDNGGIEGEPAVRLESAITRIEAHRAGVPIAKALLQSTVALVNDPHNEDIKMGFGL
jgi:hypothetical protein